MSLKMVLAELGTALLALLAGGAAAGMILLLLNYASEIL